MSPEDIPEVPFTLVDARGFGWNDHKLKSLLNCGGVRRACHGVYVSGQVPDTLATRARALSLVLPTGAAVCRRTAAWLYGVDARAIGERSSDPPLQVLVDARSTVIHRKGVEGFSAGLFDSDEIVEIEGCRVTSPLRTATDLGRWLPRLEAVAVIDQFLRLDLVKLDALIEQVVRFARHKGVRQLAFAVRIADPLAESPGESWLRVVIVDAGLPRPRAQVEFLDGLGEVRFRVDLGYDEVKLGLEYMGVEVHSGIEKRQRDDRRSTSIEDEYGWHIQEFWMGDVLGRRPTAPRRVAEALLARGFVIPDRVLERIARSH